MGALCRVQIAPRYLYVGGQRFILKGVADAEQHFFVAADSARRIHELYWLQIEQLLPGAGQGYDYSSDSARRVDALAWAVNLHLNRGSPPPGSDGAAMMRYLQAAGYQFLVMAPRLRLVYLPEPGGRREFMIVYLAAQTIVGSDTTLDAALTRAQRGVHFFPCH
jgi:hypothetical protein